MVREERCSCGNPTNEWHYHISADVSCALGDGVHMTQECMERAIRGWEANKNTITWHHGEE